MTESTTTVRVLDLSHYPFRIKCPLCENITVASDNPIDDRTMDLLDGVPCSECVTPDDFAKKIGRQ